MEIHDREFDRDEGTAVASANDPGMQTIYITLPTATEAIGSAAHPESIERRQLLLDDSLTVQNPDRIRYLTPGPASGDSVHIGDTVDGLVGNIRFSRGSGGAGDEAFRLELAVEPSFGPRASERLVSVEEGL